MDERTMIDTGALPAGWQRATLGSLCHGDGRYGSSAPAEEFDPDLPRYIRITDISDDGTLRADSPASLSRTRAAPYRLAPGDLLFARSGATVGKAYLYNSDDGECAHAGYLICFHLDPDRCVPGFVSRFTQTSYYRTWVSRTLRQAAQPNINATEFAALELPLPPLEEQRCIVKVLKSAEQLLQTSEQVVSKLALIKQMLLHELLTFGVDESGALRRGGVRRDSPIGPIPAHWRVEPVEALLAPGKSAMRSGPFGSELKKSDMAPDGVPVLGIDNVGVDSFIARYKRFVSWAKLPKLERYRVRPGDVMITIMGTIGRACVVPESVGKAISSKHVWTMTFDGTRYLPELVSLQFNHARWVREQFGRDEQGGTMSAIRSETLRATLLPVPPLAEQRAMVSALRAYDSRLAVERAVLQKNRLARKALIDELYTGRLRATGLTPWP